MAIWGLNSYSKHPDNTTGTLPVSTARSAREDFFWSLLLSDTASFLSLVLVTVTNRAFVIDTCPPREKGKNVAILVSKLGDSLCLSLRRRFRY